MAIDKALQPKKLLRLNYPALSAHFIEFIGKEPSVEHVNTINTQLLDLIHSEALPSNVYKIWLPIAMKHFPQLLSTALRDPISHNVRAIGIQQVARFSRTSTWKSSVWDSLGNAEGIKDIVGGLSIVETASLLGAIAKGIHRQDDDLPVLVEQLVHLLQQDKSSRSLWHHLDTLLPLCTASYLEDVLSSIPEARLTSKLLARIAVRHPTLLRRIATGGATVPKYVQKSVTENCVRAMVGSSVPYTPVKYQPDTLDTLPGIEFAVDLLHTMLVDTMKSVNPSRINPYIHGALRHVCRQKASFQHIFYLVSQALPIIAIETFKDLTELLVTELIRYWSIASFGTAIETKSPTKGLPHREHPSRPTVDDKERLEALLIDVIHRRCPVQLSQIGRGSLLFKTIQTVLGGIAAEARLPFIKLFCRHSSELEIDLDLPPSIKEKKLFPIWPHSIMDLLPPADIKQLFDRMLVMHGCTEYLPALDGEGSLLSWPVQCQLKARCEADVATTDDDFPTTKAGIFEMERRAAKDKDPVMRSYWANQATETALVTGSLGIFNEVMQWSTRFIRDSVVFPGLVQSYILGSKSSKLLGCVEARSTGGTRTLAALQQRTKEADKILMRMLELLMKASKEPLDRARIAGGILTFLESVVANRMRSLRRHRKQLSASETNLAGMMLDPLIEVLLHYDRKGVEHNWWTGKGPMLSGLHIQHFNTPTFLSFMDRLIQRRDELWKSKAGEEMFDEEGLFDDDDDVVPDDKQEDGFPVGLTVQHLIPSYLVPFAVERPDSIPYAATKINDVLFGAVKVLMRPVIDPEDVDDMEVDELESVITSYVGHCSRKYQNQRLMRVWKHYATVLAPHPEHLSIFRHWLAEVAQEWGWEKVSRMIDSIPMPETPYLDQPLGKDVMKWDPFGLAGQKTEITVPLTVLYCRMHRRIPPTSVIIEQIIEGSGPERMWSSDYINHVSQTLGIGGCDAVVLSALLFLGTLPKQAKQPLLPETFPSSEAARWPPIALGSRFLSLANKNVSYAAVSAIQALSEGIAFVPTEVLYRLVMSLLDNLKPASDSGYPVLLKCVVELTKLFPSTDKPEKGIDVILRIIEHFPDDSAYHRHLKLISLGKALHPDEAVRLVQSLSDFVCERLSSPSAFVKITTVKMVAQLVAAADFIPTGRSLSILQSIYGASSQVDVQTEVISSMLSLLERDSEKADDSYLFLQKLSLSTVRPSGEEHSPKGTREEGEGKLPDITGLCSQRNLELFTLTAFHKMPESHRSRYVQEVLLPMIDESIAQHNRWMKSFLHHFEVLESSNIDFGPFVPDTIDFMLNIWHDHLPASFLRTHSSSVLAYITSPIFETINEHIVKSAKASSVAYASAIQHWNEVLGFHRRANQFHHLNSLLMRGLKPALPETTGITDKAICSEYQYRMGIVTRNPVTFDASSNGRIVSHSTVINGLTSLRRVRDDTSTNPHAQYKRYQFFNDLMYEIYLDVERAREDKTDNALSAKLPSTLHLETKLLPAAHFNPLHPDPSSSFAEKVVKLIQQCTDSVTLFESHHIDEMMGSVAGNLALPLALKLGDGLDANSTEMQTCLTVRIVAKLLSKVKRSEIRADGKVEGMLMEWKRSGNEYVSRMAWQIDG
ncbi:uncharacterized protein KD926_004292 [Aspergillus affinis]|uniref:uncharacterized protein n=1 Tax=Aspergillus affinis TaxID=1070780 RepID=UPI0022FF30AD|nr:uncharacterized protein KD926_004292 [Aspergillus affinis]KAI9035208.1 hypothetical protein KD926_004292 [Aspergillus affinis]